MIELFTNPVLAPSLWGTVWMSVSASLLGALLFLKKQSLMGETLSHAAFPGLLIGACTLSSSWLFSSMTLGACLSAFLGFRCVEWMRHRGRVHADPAQTFVLASWMGWGVLTASALQQIYPSGYRQALLYLYGQAATMTLSHTMLYLGFTLVVITFIGTFFPYLHMILFDETYASTRPIWGRRQKHWKTLQFALLSLTTLATVLGTRTVGVVLMAGMLIAPAIAARAWATTFRSLMLYSALFGALSAVMGNAISYYTPSYRSLPTGPTILLSATALCMLSMMLAPRRGWLPRLGQSVIFQLQCKTENGLKRLWKDPSTWATLPLWLRGSLRYRKWVDRHGILTPRGNAQAQKIVRLHRLWEVYLVEHLGQQAEKVHKTAEELEHYFSHELERELSTLLDHPTQDPHQQPIPPRHEP